jgi:hypothetical protein
VHGRPLLRDSSNILVGNAGIEIQAEEQHDGFRNICTQFESAATRLRYAESSPERLLTFPHLPAVGLDERIVDFGAERPHGFCFMAFNLANVCY